MDYRIGDRVKWIYTYEIVNFPTDGYVSIMCISLDDHTLVQLDQAKIGIIYRQPINALYTSVYLGNFSKSENFTTLYDILNEA